LVGFGYIKVNKNSSHLVNSSHPKEAS